VAYVFVSANRRNESAGETSLIQALGHRQHRVSQRSRQPFWIWNTTPVTRPPDATRRKS